MLKIKIVSGLEKPFLDQRIEDFEALEHISALRGERLTLMLLTYLEDEGDGVFLKRLRPRFSGALARFASLKRVRSVPVTMASRHAISDPTLLRRTPGLYPDLIEPLGYGGEIRPYAYALEALLIDIEIPEDAEAGEDELRVSVSCPALDGAVLAEAAVRIEVIGAVLPRQKLKYTQWLHCDCLADYYGVDTFSEEHWRIIEDFAACAVKNGINMLLTPLFTPPVDVVKGKKWRRTTQLIGVTLKGGEYSFDYTKLDQWVEMCDRVGVKYFEMAHLFSQGGCEYSTKVMATVDGEYKCLFGWHTPSSDPEYHRFLRVFIKDLLSHMEKRGNRERCFFHISDEPKEEHLPAYKQATEAIKEALGENVIMDALSDFSFYSEGIVEAPVVYIGRIKPFLEAGVKGLWAYYCGQSDTCSGNNIAMTGARTRWLGAQLFKYNIEGFLHWGYNFYNNCDSVDPINPFTELSGEGWVTAGDAFSVYPARDGKPLESLRLLALKAGIDDISAMELCASLYSKAEVIAAWEEAVGAPTEIDVCVNSASTLLAAREKINVMIRAKI